MTKCLKIVQRQRSEWELEMRFYHENILVCRYLIYNRELQLKYFFKNVVILLKYVAADIYKTITTFRCNSNLWAIGKRIVLGEWTRKKGTALFDQIQCIKRTELEPKLGYSTSKILDHIRLCVKDKEQRCAQLFQKCYRRQADIARSPPFRREIKLTESFGFLLSQSLLDWFIRNPA